MKPKPELFRFDVLPRFNTIDPNDPIRKAGNERMQHYCRNLNMQREQESRMVNQSWFPLLIGSSVAMAVYVIVMILANL